MRARWTRSRFQPASAVSAAPRPPSTAREWTEHLAELSRQLGADSKLVREHWHHGKLFRALAEAAVALGHAHPGGIDQLQPRR